MLSRPHTLPLGFVPPCLPTKAPQPPSGRPWLHEIKHDGFRVIARKDGGRVKLYSRPGNDLTARFPLIVEAIARLRSRSWIIDGEVVVRDDSGIAQFNRIRYRSYDSTVILYGDGGTGFRVSNIEQIREHLTVYSCTRDAFGVARRWWWRLSMSDLAYVTDANIKRFRNLLETSIDETERQTIQRLLIEELARAEPSMRLLARHGRLA